MSAVSMTFGHLLRKYRRLRNLSQAEVADKLGLSRISVANFENCKQKASIDHAVKLAMILDFSLDELKQSVTEDSLDNALSRIDGDLKNSLEEAFREVGI
jgi:transcriptional regulator with XRE-family HTH domain